jgi:hypothetical protein
MVNLGVPHAYKGTIVETAINKFSGMHGAQSGDADESAARIYEAVMREGAWADGEALDDEVGGKKVGGNGLIRVVVGSDAYQRALFALEQKVENVSLMKDVAASIDTK